MLAQFGLFGYPTRMTMNRLPTEAAKRLVKQSGVAQFFNEDGKEDSVFSAHEAIAQFQRMIISNTDHDLAKKVVHSYLYLDNQSSEDHHDEIKDKVDKILDTIAEITIPEGKSLMVEELIAIATATGGCIKWFDGKTKLEANRMLNELLNGNIIEDEASRGFLLRLAGEKT